MESSLAEDNLAQSDSLLDLGGSEDTSSSGESSLAGIGELDETEEVDDGGIFFGNLVNRPKIELTADYFGYYEAAADGSSDHFGRGNLTLSFEDSLESGFTYTLTPRIRWDSGDNSANRFEFREDGLRRPLATLHEAKVGWYSERFELSLGKNVFNWGVADAYYPVDNLSPRDYLDVPTNDRIGVPAVSLYHVRDLVEFQAVWQPWFTPSRIPLPGFENRWLSNFESFLAQSANRLGLRPDDFSFSGVDLPEDDLDNSQFDARISSSTLIDGWDLGLIYTRGNQSTGVFRADMFPGEVISSLHYPRYHEVGASVSTVLGDWEIHGEGAYHDTDESAMDDDYIEYVVGVNRSFSDLPIPGVEETRLILEYAGEEVTKETTEGSPFFGSGQFARPFEDAIVGSLAFKFSDDTELEVSGSYDFADEGAFFEASLTHKLSDNFKANIGTNMFAGPTESFFGKWADNDRFFLTLTMTY